MGDRGGKSARDVVGDVLAADRQHVRHDQVIFVEHREGGGGATHIDDGDTQRLLVLGQHGAGCGIGRHHEARNREMRTLHRHDEVLEVRRLDGDDTEVEGQIVAEQPRRVLDATGVVEVILQRRDVHDGAPAGIDLVERGIEGAVLVALHHLAALRGHRADVALRHGAAA